MCGRYTSTSTVDDLASIFEVDEVKAEPSPARYNVAPTTGVLAVAVTSDARRALGRFRWGLVPSWAKDQAVGNRMINARSETIATKPAFRAAVNRRRCIIPADAFYEWQRRVGPEGKPAGKLPHAIRRRDGQPMAFAGIWEIWRDKNDPSSEPVRSCAIITTSANALMAPIHDRMPVILASGDWGRWLDPTAGMAEIQDLMVPSPPEWLEAYPVSTLVNKVGQDGPQLLEPLPAPPAPV